MTKISVLMPVYNVQEKYLREAIESILNQTFNDFEFIILDDCSTIDIESIVKSYNDNRIKFYKNTENLGVANSRNKLLELATGEYIALMDDDDISLPQRFEKQITFLEQNLNISAVSAAIETFPQKEIRIQPEIVNILDLLKCCCIAHPAAMLRKSAIEKYNLRYNNQFTCSQDYKFWADAIKHIQIANLSEVLLKYRLHQESITQQKQDLAKKEDLIIKQDILNFLTADKQLQENIKKLLHKEKILKFSERMFSINNLGNKKIIRFLGVKISIKNTKPVLEYFETHLTDHCNLNCKACNHFCPITPKTFCDTEKLKEDMKNLSLKFNVKKIRLLGGEPLLHKDINTIIENTRYIFPKADIRIVSNGTLIKNMDKTFWDTCIKNKITIDLSHYPAVKNFDEIIQTIKDNKVKVGFINKVDNFWRTLNADGTSEITNTFENCKIFRECKTLYNGKIYKCPIGAYIYRYNNHFNEQIPEESGIDIKQNSAEEIINYLNTPIATCKYCVMPSDKWGLTEWSVSKGEKDEWFISK